MISEIKKKPEQWDHSGKTKRARSIRRWREKKGWPGEIKVLEKGPNQFEGAEKKECPREVFSLLLRHSAFVK